MDDDDFGFDDDFKDLKDLNEDDLQNQPPQRPVHNPTPASSFSSYFGTASSSTLPASTRTDTQLGHTLALSPIGPGPIMINSDEEEDEMFWNSNNGRPIAPLPSRGSASTSPKGKAPAPPPPAGDNSSEYNYDDEFDLDPSILAQLDEIEQQAYSASGPSGSGVSHPRAPPGPPAHPDSSSGLGVGVRAALPAASTSTATRTSSNARSGSVNRTGSVARTGGVTRTTTGTRTGSRAASRAPSKPPIAEDVISIDSSSEGEQGDKENVPVKRKATRRVAQGGRQARQPVVRGEYAADVIDLSD